MPPPRRLSPYRRELRSHSPRSSFRSSWSPREQQRSRSPQRARFSRSPRRHSPSPYKSRLPERRSQDSSRDYGYTLKISGYRSRSSSPVQAKKFREEHSHIDERRRHHTHSRSRSPSPHRSPSPCGSKTYGGMPSTLRMQEVRHDTIDFVKIVDRGPKMEKLDKRFQTVVQAAQGLLDFELNITIAIHQGPSHMEIDDMVAIPVNYEFNSKAIPMIFPSKDYSKGIFDRDEIKAFRHDDVLDEEAYGEKRTITVKPVRTPKHNKYDDDELDYRMTFSMDRDWSGDKRSIKDFQSKSCQSRRLDPRYEREHRRHEECSISHERIHKNLDDSSASQRRRRSDKDDFRRRDSQDLELRVSDPIDLDRKAPRDLDHSDSRDLNCRDSRDLNRRESRDRKPRSKVGKRKLRDKFRDDRFERPPRDRGAAPQHSVDDFQPELDPSYTVGKINKSPVKLNTAERWRPVVLTDLPNIRNRPGAALVKPNVWIIGSTVVRDIQRFFEQRPELELQKQLADVIAEVNYHGDNDLRIADLLPAVKYMMKLHDLPQMIIFQCAEHNVCVGRNIDLLHSMKKDLLLMKADIPNVKLVWGQILPPWMDKDLNGLTLAKSRRRINRFMMQCFLSDEIGGAFLYHPQIRTDMKTRFYLPSSDKFLHLNILGMETLLMQFKAGIKYFCTGHGSIFPCFKWPPKDISKIEPECICMLDKEHIQDITKLQFNDLTREQIRQFSIDQISMFHFTQFPWLFCEHFIQNLSPLQINGLTKENFKHVTAEQLDCFTDDQKKWLTEDVKAHIEMKRVVKMIELVAKEIEPMESQDHTNGSGNVVKQRKARSKSLSNASDGSQDYAGSMVTPLVPYESPELSPTTLSGALSPSPTWTSSLPPARSSPLPEETWVPDQPKFHKACL